MGKSNKILIIVLVTLVVVFASISLVLFVSKLNNKVDTDEKVQMVENTEYTDTTEVNKETGVESENTALKAEIESLKNEIASLKNQKTTIKIPSVDSIKCLNAADNIKYTVGKVFQFSGINVYIRSSKHVEMTYTGDSTNKLYGIGSADDYNMQTKEITNFSNNVVDVYIDGMGQAVGDETLFFLLEDGTVEYMPVRYALKNNDIRSYGILSGVNNVIGFASSGATSGFGGYHIPVAITNDGSFYDLREILVKTDYYKY